MVTGKKSAELASVNNSHILLYTIPFLHIFVELIIETVFYELSTSCFRSKILFSVSLLITQNISIKTMKVKL